MNEGRLTNSNDYSYSMVVDRKRKTIPLNIPHTHPNKNRNINHPIIPAASASVENRRVHTWVRDSTVKDCYTCKELFTLWNRKHHCRLCGRVFCTTCSSYRLKIPDFLANFLPRPPNETITIARNFYEGLTTGYSEPTAANARGSDPGQTGVETIVPTPSDTSLMSRVPSLADNLAGAARGLARDIRDQWDSQFQDGRAYYQSQDPMELDAVTEMQLASSPGANALMHHFVEAERAPLLSTKAYTGRGYGTTRSAGAQASGSAGEPSRELDSAKDPIGNGTYAAAGLGGNGVNRKAERTKSVDLGTGVSEEEKHSYSRKKTEDATGKPRANASHSLPVIDLSRPKRLCKPCYLKLNELTRLRYLIHLFGLSGTTIRDLKTYSLVCKDWLGIASYHLSRFREIQYYLPHQQYSEYDRQMLWDNREYMLGHSIWLTQLIRSLDYRRPDHEERLEDVIRMLGLRRAKRILIEGPTSKQNESDADASSTNNGPEPINVNGAVDKEVVWDFDRGNSRNRLSLNISASMGAPSKTEMIEMTELTRRTSSVLDSVRCGEVSHEKALPKDAPASVKKIGCWTLMCTRNCRKGLRPEDALCLLDHRTQAPELRKYAMGFLERTDLAELRCYLPLLINCMKFESLDNPIIGRSLLRVAVGHKGQKAQTQEVPARQQKERLMFANDLFWQLTVAMESRSRANIYKYFLDQFCAKMSKKVLEAIFKGKHMSVTLQCLLEEPDEERMRHNLRCQISSDALEHLASPTNPFIRYKKLLTDRVKHTDSASRPIILPFKVASAVAAQCAAVNGVSSGSGSLAQNLPPRIPDREVQVLFKNEDLRKDKIIINLIRLTHLILKREEGLDLGLITYEVCPTSTSCGVLEMVPRCRTLYDIKERMVLSINNFIDSHSDDIPVQTLRHRFVRSCAGYCVITYLLGIGDRHLDNIMITEDGYIFHIDYGFVLGADPKPMTVPTMRLTTEMVEAMGGTDSKYYREFMEISNKVYNCLRRHVGLFINMLSLLIDSDPEIENRTKVTRELLLKEVYKRFIPGETYHEAQIQLETEIEQSSQNYTHVINDFFHRHAREKTLTGTVSSTFKTIKGFFKS